MYKMLTTAFLVSTITISHGKTNSSGAYIGANIGGSFTHSTFSDEEKATINNIPNVGIRDRAHGGIFNPLIGAFLGYNYKVNSCFYLGAEILVDGTRKGSTHVHVRDDNSNVNPIRLTHSLHRHGVGFGILARAGLMVSNNTALFFGLGIKSTAWRLKSHDVRANVTASKSHRSAKLHLQAGAEGLFSETCFGWRTSYSYTHGKHIKINTFPTRHVFDLLPGTFARAKPTEHTVSAGVFYKF